MVNRRCEIARNEIEWEGVECSGKEWFFLAGVGRNEWSEKKKFGIKVWKEVGGSEKEWEKVGRYGKKWEEVVFIFKGWEGMERSGNQGLTHEKNRPSILPVLPLWQLILFVVLHIKIFLFLILHIFSSMVRLRVRKLDKIFS